MNRIWKQAVSVGCIFVIGTMASTQPLAQAHCQVPCGIYDDAARIAAMKEDCTTISKAIGMIQQLAGDTKPQSVNQMVRWINTKEDHASKIIETVSTYFLTQKVKPVANGDEGYQKYLLQLADHHAVMSAAMKTKQTVDESAATALLSAIERLATHYHTSH